MAERPPGEALVDIRRRLPLLLPRDPGRVEIVTRAADAYGVSIWTLYRALRELNHPKSVRRADHGTSRIAPQSEMETYAEIITVLKIRTANRKGRHISTARAIKLLEEDGLVRAPPGLLKRVTIDRLLRVYGLDYTRVTRPVAARSFPGAARQRTLAVRYESVRSETGRKAALGRGRLRPPAADAVLRGR